MMKIKIKGEDVFLIIGILLVAIYVLLYLNVPSFGQAIEHFIEKAKNFSLSNGYWGALIISFLGNSTVLLSIPYPTVIFILGSLGLNPIFLGLISGVASAAGEIIAYLVGLGGRQILGEKYKEKFERIHNYLARKPKTTPLIIFIFAATSLPDDIILVPLGMMKYNFWKVFIPVTLGKIIHTLSYALFGRASLKLFQLSFSTQQDLMISVASFLIIIISIYLIIKIDWTKIISRKVSAG